MENKTQKRDLKTEFKLNESNVLDREIILLAVKKKEKKSRHPRKLALRAFVYTCVFNKTHTHK